MKLERKKSILFILLSSLVILLFLVTSFSGKTKGDIYKFKKEYEEYNGTVVQEDTKYIDVDINISNFVTMLYEENVISTFSNNTGIFYFGFPTCPWCRNVVETLLKVGKKENIDVYYMNPREIRTNNSEVYQQLLKKLSGNLQKNENGEETLYVPDVYFVKKGKIVGHHIGTVKSQTNPYKKLNASQQEELEKIYTNLIKKIK